MYLISDLYTEYIMDSYKPIIKYNYKIGKDLDIHFSKENIGVTKKHMKRSSTSSIITETANQTTIRHHCICTGMIVIEMTSNSKY